MVFESSTLDTPYFKYIFHKLDAHPATGSHVWKPTSEFRLVFVGVAARRGPARRSADKPRKTLKLVGWKRTKMGSKRGTKQRSYVKV